MLNLLNNFLSPASNLPVEAVDPDTEGSTLPVKESTEYRPLDWIALRM